LNAPDYTRTCTCAYQNQTSLAFVHMPEMEMWTYSQFGLDAEEGDRIDRVGINFGAPGDRRAEDGTLWLEHPSIGGDSPGINVTVAGEKVSYFRRHISQVNGPGLAWVAASGIRDFESITVTPEILRQKITKPPSTRDDEEDEGGARGKAVGSKQKGGPRPAAAPKAESPKPVAPDRAHPAAPYTVRLHFLEPDELQPGQRVFGVSLQGQSVLENFDVAKAAGGSYRGVVKEFNGVIIQKDLKVTLNRAPGTLAGPILCGIELIAEKSSAQR
jgi:hypothetical protein